MESCGDCSFLYSRQSRYYILLVSLQAQKIAYQSNQNDLAMVFINCYYFLTVSCLPASVVHVGSNDVFVKPFSNFATIVPPRRKSTISVAKVPITSQQKYQMVQMLPKIGEIGQQKYHAYPYYYYYYYYYQFDYVQ